VCSFAAELRPLYDFVDDNPLIAFHPCDFTNDPFVIAQNDNVVAVNSALHVIASKPASAQTLARHLKVIVDPTFDDFHDNRGSVRHGLDPSRSLQAYASDGTDLMISIRPGTTRARRGDAIQIATAEMIQHTMARR
jgi:hypothetical protein